MWEYLERDDVWGGGYQRELDNLGQDGWELVAVILYEGALRYYFKRPFVPYKEEG